MGGTRLDLVFLGPGDGPLQRRYESSKDLSEYAISEPWVFIPADGIPKDIQSIFTVKGWSRLLSLTNVKSFDGRILKVQVPGKRILVIDIDNVNNWLGLNGKCACGHSDDTAPAFVLENGRKMRNRSQCSFAKVAPRPVCRMPRNDLSEC